MSRRLHINRRTRISLNLENLVPQIIRLLKTYGHTPTSRYGGTKHSIISAIEDRNSKIDTETLWIGLSEPMDNRFPLTDGYGRVVDCDRWSFEVNKEYVGFRVIGEPDNG